MKLGNISSYFIEQIDWQKIYVFLSKLWNFEMLLKVSWSKSEGETVCFSKQAVQAMKLRNISKNFIAQISLQTVSFL